VIVDDLDIFCSGGGPPKTDPILIVDADAVLSCAISLERLQAVAGRNTKILKPTRDLKLTQLSPGYCLDVDESADSPAVCKSFRICAP